MQQVALMDHSITLLQCNVLSVAPIGFNIQSTAKISSCRIKANDNRCQGMTIVMYAM